MKQFNIALFFMIVLVSCARFEASIQTALPALTITQSKTSEPAQIPTGLPTLTLLPSKTSSPTLTSTFTPIPPGSILFQQDFEDGLMGEWDQIDGGGIWTVEQEPDGNHYLCGTGPSVNPPQIWYRDRRTLWTDYAFETRVKFVKGSNALSIIFHTDYSSDEHYSVDLDGDVFGLSRTGSPIGRIFTMLPYPDRQHIFKVEIKGNSLKLYEDNRLFEDLTLQPPVISHGGIGYITDRRAKVCLDDIKVWSPK